MAHSSPHEHVAPRLYRLQTLQRYTIGATDGDVGQVETAYFDDESWTVRYVVVDTGTWLPGRKVLISPRAIERLDPARERVVTKLTRERVESSPDIDTHKPVSRQDETRYFSYYGYPDYWTGPYRWGLWADPFVLPPPYPAGAPASGLPPAVAQELAARENIEEDPHLRSAAAVAGHGIRATDGNLGHVEDFLIDEASWTIRYVIVDPQNWWPGPHVVISTEWITEVDDGEARVSVNREAVRNAPTWDPSRPVERDWETRLHRHFARRGYWDRSPESWRHHPPSS